jgi:hypothetical protein
MFINLVRDPFSNSALSKLIKLLFVGRLFVFYNVSQTPKKSKNLQLRAMNTDVREANGGHLVIE